MRGALTQLVVWQRERRGAACTVSQRRTVPSRASARRAYALGLLRRYGRLSRSGGGNLTVGGTGKSRSSRGSHEPPPLQTRGYAWASCSAAMAAAARAARLVAAQATGQEWGRARYGLRKARLPDCSRLTAWLRAAPARQA